MQQSSGFGAVGATSTPAFGAASAPAFGASSTPASAAPAFGASSSTPAFGSSSTPAFGGSGTPAFGASSSAFSFAAASAPAFGAKSAGAFSFPSASPSSFSAPISTFGQPQSAQFGQQQQQQQAQPQQQHQLSTRNNQPINDNTAWDDINEQSQQYLLHLEYVFSLWTDSLLAFIVCAAHCLITLGCLCASLTCQSLMTGTLNSNMHHGDQCPCPQTIPHCLQEAHHTVSERASGACCLSAATRRQRI